MKYFECLVLLLLCLGNGICQKKGMKKRIKTHKCKYTFVVNELDMEACPNSIPQADKLTESVSNYQPSYPPTMKSIPGPAVHAETSEVRQWLSNIEKMMYSEQKVTNELNTTLTRHEDSLKTAEKLLSEYESNFTTVFRMLRYLEGTLRKQNEASRNIDKKLSGIMLDVVEVNSVLSRKAVAYNGAIKDKVIDVQSASKITGCPRPLGTTLYKDCAEVQKDHNVSGVYYITPAYSPCPIPVWCDMETTVGGWMLVLKRENGQVDFNRLWNDYKDGFGDVTNEFYLGNDNLFLISNQKQYVLRIDLWDFNSNRVYAEYETFYIDGEREEFKLHVHGYEGSAKDSLRLHNRVKFSTPDRDNDNYPSYECAKEWMGGWWFNNCWYAFLTGPYYNISNVKYRGISWKDWKEEQLPRVEMKIRPPLEQTNN